MPDLSLNFRCPVCAAQPDQKCVLMTGDPRFNSHAERGWIADDYRHDHAPEGQASAGVGREEKAM
jgi:hypothetical protein